ncbi:MAG: hypothetical protein K9G24_09960 [Candidatus Nanopelagicales bacterium]|nr:hypothetical protein [Candidatus Nanopelagicales bacterium]MCF8538430.1 hypothetical protein [Candidatus Nanopelagicales bacterium]MCF8543391.1 hypothetical protein [Candidatus Nanopelagicales bacterium]MCF8557622.1 hypothetical protein [Candidatus Nanopelagicales bacterium]
MQTRLRTFVVGATLSAFVASTMVVGASLPAKAIVGHDPESPGHAGFTVTPPSAPYVMAFHTCSTNCEDPANHMVRLAQSADGASWSDVAGWQAYKGSVPDVFRRGDTMYVIGAGLSRIDMATGKVTADRFTVKKADGSRALARDTSFAGQLPDGRLVVTYVPSMQEVAGASEIPVLVATEDPGSDASSFTSIGAAITIPKAGLPVVGEPTDPDIFFNGAQWVLYTSVGANVVAYTGGSVTGPFSLATQVLVSSNAGGVPSGIAGSGGVWTYVNFGSSRESIEIRRGVSGDGLSGLTPASFTTVLTGSAYGATTAESPGVAANTAGIACGSGCGGGSSTSATSSSAKKAKERKPGTRCRKAGATGTYKGKTLTCKRVKGKLIWR